MSRKVMDEVWDHAPESGDELIVLLAVADQANDAGQATVTWNWLEKKTRLYGDDLLYKLFHFNIRGQMIWRGLIQNYPRDEPFQLSIPLPLTKIEGYVYLVRCGPYYKIGRTKDLSARISKLAILLPHPLLIIHTIPTDNPAELESCFHDHYSEKRLNGEWFNLDEKDIRYFSEFSEVFNGADFIRS